MFIKNHHQNFSHKTFIKHSYKGFNVSLLFEHTLPLNLNVIKKILCLLMITFSICFDGITSGSRTYSFTNSSAYKYPAAPYRSSSGDSFKSEIRSSNLKRRN